VRAALSVGFGINKNTRAALPLPACQRGHAEQSLQTRSLLVVLKKKKQMFTPAEARRAFDLGRPLKASRQPPHKTGARAILFYTAKQRCIATWNGTHVAFFLFSQPPLLIVMDHQIKII
jgi:hypothetical protein